MNIDRIIKNIKASQLFEGLEPSQDVIDLINQHYKGKISAEEVVKKIKLKYKVDNNEKGNKNE